MRHVGLFPLVSCLVLFLLACPLFAADQEGWSSWPGVATGGGALIATGAIPEDIYLAGSTVTADVQVKGDVVAAGGVVTVGGSATEGVLAAGGVVDLKGKVADDVRAAGGVVNLEGAVGHDAVLAGGTVNLLPRSSVGGRGFLAGGVVRVDGSVGGDLRVAAGKVILNGKVKGAVKIVADEVEIGKTAEVDGKIYCRSRVAPRIEPGATLKGEVTREELPQRWQRHRRWSPWSHLALGLVWVLALGVTGMVYLLLFPAFVNAGAARIKARTWSCLGLGLAGLATVPIAALLLLFTVLGIPLGLALGALYPVLLLAGSLTGSWFLADMIGSGLGKGGSPSLWVRAGFFILAVLVLRIAQSIPFLGGWVIFLFLLAGVGSVLQGVHARWKGDIPA